MDLDIDFICSLPDPIPYRSPTSSQVVDLLKQTKGVLDADLCRFLRLTPRPDIETSIYTGPLDVSQRAEVFHWITDDSPIHSTGHPARSIRIGDRYQASALPHPNTSRI